MNDHNKRPSSGHGKHDKVSTKVSFEERESGYGTAPENRTLDRTTPSRPNSTSTTMPRSSCKPIWCDLIHNTDYSCIPKRLMFICTYTVMYVRA